VTVWCVCYAMLCCAMEWYGMVWYGGMTQSIRNPELSIHVDAVVEDLHNFAYRFACIFHNLPHKAQTHRERENAQQCTAMHAKQGIT